MHDLPPVTLQVPIAIIKLQNLSIPASTCLVHVCLYNQKKHINIIFLVTPSPLLLSWKENMNVQKQQLALWNAGQFLYTELSGLGMLKNVCLWWLGPGQQTSIHTAACSLISHSGTGKKIRLRRARKFASRNKDREITHQSWLQTRHTRFGEFISI